MKANAFLIFSRSANPMVRRVFRVSVFIFSFFLASVSTVDAQEHVHDDDCSALFGSRTVHNIQFGQSLNLSVFNQTSETPSWQVSPVKGVSPSSGKGNTAESVQFNEPGRYEVTFTIPGDSHRGLAIVEVSDTRMVFDTKSVVLSQPIKKGVSVEGTTLTIQVEVSSKNKKSVEYTAPKVSTAGVTGISAELKEPVKLKNGTHTLTFHLTGTPEYSGMAQLGFFNPLGEGFFYNFLIAE